MSTNWAADIARMHLYYDFKDAVLEHDSATVAKHFDFREKCIGEEHQELNEAETAADAVDAIIDMIVFGIGTLDLMGVDVQKAWDTVLYANMDKTTGIKEGRPNPLGLPDLIKPAFWQAPNHDDNVGRLAEITWPRVNDDSQA